MDAVTHIPPKPRQRSVPDPGPRPETLRLPPDPLEPARRAGATLLLLAAVALLLGIFLIISPLDPQQSFVSTAQLYNAGGILTAGVAFGILGLIVRGGGRLPAVLALIIAVAAWGYVIVLGVADVRHNHGIGNSMMSLLFLAAILASLILLIRWLWQVAVIAGQLHAFRQRHGLAPSPPRKA